MWFLYFVNFLTWLGTLALIGLAVYLHYFVTPERNVAGLVIGAVVLGWVSGIMTAGIAEELEKRRKKDDPN